MSTSIPRRASFPQGGGEKGNASRPRIVALAGGGTAVMAREPGKPCFPMPSTSDRGWGVDVNTRGRRV